MASKFDKRGKQIIEKFIKTKLVECSEDFFESGGGEEHSLYWSDLMSLIYMLKYFGDGEVPFEYLTYNTILQEIEKTIGNQIDDREYPYYPGWRMRYSDEHNNKKKNWK